MGTADMEISHTVQTAAMVGVCVTDITVNSLNINMETDIDEVYTHKSKLGLSICSQADLHCIVVLHNCLSHWHGWPCLELTRSWVCCPLGNRECCCWELLGSLNDWIKKHRLWDNNFCELHICKCIAVWQEHSVKPIPYPGAWGQEHNTNSPMYEVNGALEGST